MQYKSQCAVYPQAYPSRNENVVWRDISGEVVIADRNNGTIRILNETASVFWTLSDGTRKIDDIASSISERYEVSEEESRQDSIEFCRNLVEAKLLSLSDAASDK